MPMVTETRPWTRDDLARLPDDGNRYEVLDGALLVTPAPDPGHNDVAFLLARRLDEYCSAHSIGVAFVPGAVPHGTNELQPDVTVVPGISRPVRRTWAELPSPLLVVEILSPSTQRRDLGLKRAAYARFGIPEYWSVDRDAQHVTVVRIGHGDLVVRETLRWQPYPAFPALEISLTQIFG